MCPCSYTWGLWNSWLDVEWSSKIIWNNNIKFELFTEYLLNLKINYKLILMKKFSFYFLIFFFLLLLFNIIKFTSIHFLLQVPTSTLYKVFNVMVIFFFPQNTTSSTSKRWLRATTHWLFVNRLLIADEYSMTSRITVKWPKTIRARRTNRKSLLNII